MVIAMLTVFILVAVLLSDDGKVNVQTFEFASAEECREGANAFQEFLKTHDLGVVSGTWGCTQWELITPAAKPLAPKSNS